MKTLRHLFSRPGFTFGGGSRFDRYYGEILRAGSGYPTADEARRDLIRYDRATLPYNWPR